MYDLINAKLWEVFWLLFSWFFADETETEFHYKPGEIADPSKWSSIKAEWKICGTGKRQSPINLTPEIARIVHNSTEILQTYYKPVEAILKNRGFDMKVIVRTKI